MNTEINIIDTHTPKKHNTYCYNKQLRNPHFYKVFNTKGITFGAARILPWNLFDIFLISLWYLI